MAELTIPPSINDERSQAYLKIVERLGALDLTPILVYRLDSVPDSALPFLAWQFDILSPLWQLFVPLNTSVDALTDIDALTNIDALTEGPPDEQGALAAAQAQRTLLKMAIPLHRYRGTPWAIKTALASLGWPSVTLLEGQNSWGGTSYPASEGWALFRVVVNLAADQVVEGSAPETIEAAVNFFKPVRSWLDSIWFSCAPMIDSAPVPFDRLTLQGVLQYELDTVPVPVEGPSTFTLAGLALSDAFGPLAPLYDKRFAYSGITYGANEPVVADQALIVNGAAVLQGG